MGAAAACGLPGRPLGVAPSRPLRPPCPKEFAAKARALLAKVQGAPGIKDEDLRRALLKFIGDFANWDMAANETYLSVGRGLVKAAHPEETPLVVDPFAGGGSIPLEALRLGCDTFASDLNPVACLILKVMLEDIPRHGSELARNCAGLAMRSRKGREGTGRVLPERSGWGHADCLPLGADGEVRVAQLRGGNAAHALILALQEGESQTCAQV